MIYDGGYGILYRVGRRYVGLSLNFFIIFNMCIKVRYL